MFEEVWEGIMKGQPKGSRKQDVYSEFSRVKKAEDALLGAQTEITRLKARLAVAEGNPRGQKFGGGMGGVMGAG